MGKSILIFWAIQAIGTIICWEAIKYATKRVVRRLFQRKRDSRSPLPATPVTCKERP